MVDEVWKGSMNGACPQCRVQVEEEKGMDGISGIRRQWIHDRKMKGGLKHLFSWMVSLDIFFLLFLFSRNVYYFLLDDGRIVNRRMKRIGEWKTLTYEKVWIQGVEWVGGRHGCWMLGWKTCE